MRISETNKFLFDHIPKSGGIFLRKNLKKILKLSNHKNIDCGPNFHIKNEKKIKSLLNYDLISGHLRGDVRNYILNLEKRYLITLFRDPIEIIISTYKYWKYDVKKDLPLIKKIKALTFEDFIHDDNFNMTTNNQISRHMISHWDINLINSESLYFDARREILKFDTIFINELLNEQIPLFCQKLNIPNRIKYFDKKKINKSKKIEIRFSQEEYNFLKNKNKIDYLIYDYFKKNFIL